MGFSLLFASPARSGKVATTTVPAMSPEHVVTLTGYNAVPGQTDDTPFETASGAYSNPEVVAARSQDLAEELPFGTIIELDGSAIADTGSCGFSAVEHEIGYRVIADAMNKKFTDRLDVLLDTDATYRTTDKGMKNPAQVLGICKGVTYRVVGRVSIGKIPSTQAELALLVKGGAATLALK